MKNLIRETFKLVILFIIIGIGTVFITRICEPVHVKADRLQRQGKNIASELTVKERDEYMAYLYAITTQNDEPESIYKWELP